MEEPNPKRKWRLLLPLLALAVVLIWAVTAVVGRPTPAPVDPRGMSPSMAAMAREFNVLRLEHSNRCSLTAAEVMGMPATTRLRGSCCQAMDFQHYVHQRRGLRPYRSIGLVPTDPYDVPVSLAKRLLTLGEQIHLTAEHQQTYDRAVSMSEEHGPCCCRCWRWDVFEAQAKVLIAERGIGAEDVARIWKLEDGCGG